MTFEESFAALLGHEGGYVNDPADPGGETKFGISKRAYPKEDIAGMTVERAREIYRRDYWNAIGCDLLPDCIRFDVFDMAVNSGVAAAVRNLQTAANVESDGRMGPLTMRAVNAMPPVSLVARFNGARLVFLAGLPNWPRFSRGWARRIASNLLR